MVPLPNRATKLGKKQKRNSKRLMKLMQSLARRIGDRCMTTLGGQRECIIGAASRLIRLGRIRTTRRAIEGRKRTQHTRKTLEVITARNHTIKRGQIIMGRIMAPIRTAPTVTRAVNATPPIGRTG